MRIGVDARELQGRTTGTGRYLRNLLREWLAAGDDAIVAYFNGPPPSDPVLNSLRLSPRAVGPGGRRGLLWEQRALPAAAKADGLDVFFSPAYTCPLRLPVPRVTMVHDLSFFALPHEFGLVDGLRRRTLVKASVRASARVLAQSDFTRRELGAWFPDAAARVRTVPLGPDDDLPAGPPRAEARAALGAGGPVLLTVGSIFNRRRLPELLQAVAALRRTRPGLRLEVVGENRSHPFLDVDALVDRLGLGPHVRLSGFLSDAELALRYAAADVAVFLSDYEGFGLGVLEAMARGLPAVVSRAPAMGEIYGEAALLVDPRDPFAVAGAVGRILDDAALRAALVARGQALAGRYSWAATAAATRAVLAEAAGA